MFSRESEMAKPVVDWMTSVGVTNVKHEFAAPWGMCDVVGLTFNLAHVRSRRELRQTTAIGSVIGTSVLLRIPDSSTGTSIPRRLLAGEFDRMIRRDVFDLHLARLISGHFVEELPGDRLHKRNGWYPLHDRLVAVELKLSRIQDALQQARNNLGFASASYVALPSEVARRVEASSSRWSHFFDGGVGLLAVGTHRCRVLIPSRGSEDLRDEALQFYCVEKFWRTRAKDN